MKQHKLLKSEVDSNGRKTSPAPSTDPTHTGSSLHQHQRYPTFITYTDCAI